MTNTKKNVKTENKTKTKHKGLKIVLYTILLIIFFSIIAVCVAATTFFIYIAVNAPT